MMKVSSMSMEANAIAVGMTAGSNLGRPATVSTMTDNVSHEPTLTTRKLAPNSPNENARQREAAIVMVGMRNAPRLCHQR